MLTMSEILLEITAHSPFTNVADYILSNLDNYGDRESIKNTFNNETYNFQDVKKLALNVSVNLQSRGFLQGDTILYSSHDGAKLHIFLLGIWQAGGIARASYPEDFGEDLLQRVLESDVKWIFCDEQNVQENLKIRAKVPWPLGIIVSGNPPQNCISIDEFFKNKDDVIQNQRSFDAPASCKIIISGNPTENCTSINALFRNKDAVIQNFKGSLDSPALILQTSGTTGNSKGALYTHRGLLNNIKLLETVPFTKDPLEKFLLTSKLTHYTGTVIPLSFISSGRGILIDPKPSMESILKAIIKHKVDGLLAFPKYLQCLANSQEGHKSLGLKYAMTGGQLVGPSFVSSVKTIAGLESFSIIYGMTEVGVIGVTAVWNKGCQLIDDIPAFSCGKLPPGNEILVRDLQTNEIVGDGQVGEFYIRSPYSAKGYYKRPEETQKTFGDDGWVRSGDVGFMKDGFIHMKDRVKEIFKYFNNHICPSELENIILKHPIVSQVGVVGVPDPDGGDTIPRAFVVLKEASSNEKHVIDDIHKFVNGIVPSYKMIRGGIFILPELPLGKTGKVMRNVLQTLRLPQGPA